METNVSNVLQGAYFITGLLRHVICSQVARVLDEDNPIHVPINLWARTSVLDLWLAVEKWPKSVLYVMTG